MFKFFKRKTQPTPRGFYAVLHGTYKGNFFVFINQEFNNVNCLLLPDKQILKSPYKDFCKALKDEVFELVEKLPKKVFKTVEDEYLKLNNSNGLSRTKKNYKSDKRVTGRT